MVFRIVSTVGRAYSGVADEAHDSRILVPTQWDRADHPIS